MSKIIFKFNTLKNKNLIYMTKNLLKASLWGILTLSTLFSCRTEDGAIAQKQIEDKRFAVFVPKSGQTVNYANGFEFLIKRYDEIKKTNISGINNPIKNNLSASSDKGSFLFQNKGSYVEFKVRSQVITEENGEKWMIFPRVENNQVIGLIMSTLKEKETLIAFDEIRSDSDYYKQLLPLFQEAFNRYNRRKASLALNASIQPMAIGGEGAEPGGGGSGKDCGDDVQKCGNIEEVIVPGKPKDPVTPPTIPIGVSSCWDIANCPVDPGSEGGGGGSGGGSTDMVMIIKPKYYIRDLKKYLSCLNTSQPANLIVYAEKMGDGSGVGHAFISITQGDNRMTFGFYPDNPDSWLQKSLHYYGVMGDNSDSYYTHSKNYGQISPTQLKNIVSLALKFDTITYNILASNCSTFASDVMTIAGETNIAYKPDTPNTVISRFGSGSNNQSGKGPQTKSTCNQ